MFLIELLAGLAAGSASLQADALDFLSDAANYVISLSVLGLALRWRARAALIKGVSMGTLGLWVGGSTIWHAMAGTVPEAYVMGAVGALALLANFGFAVMLTGTAVTRICDPSGSARATTRWATSPSCWRH